MEYTVELMRCYRVMDGSPYGDPIGYASKEITVAFQPAPGMGIEHNKEWFKVLYVRVDEDGKWRCLADSTHLLRESDGIDCEKIKQECIAAGFKEQCFFDYLPRRPSVFGRVKEWLGV